MIMSFSQKGGESFYLCWERFKDLLNACPHHGFEKWRIVSFFYDGLNSQTRQFVDMMCQCQFLNKQPDAAFDYLDALSENAQTWEFLAPSKNDHKSDTRNTSSIGTKYQLNEENALNVKIIALSRKVDELISKQVNHTQIQSTDICGVCAVVGHSTMDCSLMPAFENMKEEQANVLNQYRRSENDPYSNTYNPGWRNHPNFNWKERNLTNANGSSSYSPYQRIGNQAQQSYQSYNPYPMHLQPRDTENSLADTLNKFVQTTQKEQQEHRALTNQNAQEVKDIKTMLTQLTNSLQVQEKGKFPAQPRPNPQGQFLTTNAISSSGQDIMSEQVQSITTLRSGK